MKGKDKKVHAWVHPSFHKLMRVESADKGITMIQFTESLAREFDCEDGDRKRKGSERWKFGF